MTAGVATSAVVSFSVSSWAGNIQSATIDGEELPVIDVTGWGSTVHRRMIFGKLKTPPVIEFEFTTDMDDPPDVDGSTAAETMTITFPLPSGQTTEGTLVVSGKITARSFDLGGDGDSMSGSMTFTCDGTTVTYTASA